MELSGYILRIAPFVINPPKIDDNTKNVLSLFIFDSHLSKYEIHKILSKVDKQITYPSIWEKIEALHRMKLIEISKLKVESKTKNYRRKAIYYKLTEEGIFLIFSDSQLLFKQNRYYIKNALIQWDAPGSLLEYEKEIYKTHPNCLLFTIFLNPWISMDTLSQLGPRLITLIRRFLVDCCLLIREQILTLNEIIPLVYLGKPERITKSEFLDFEALTQGIVKREAFPLTHLLKDSFNLDLTTVILKRLDKNSVTISDLDNTCLYQLIYKEAENELEIISSVNEEERITLKGISINEIITPHIGDIGNAISAEHDLLLTNIVFSILMDDIDTHDLGLVRSDFRFRYKLTELYSNFLKKYELFIK